MPTPLTLPEHFGRYRILRTVGQGAMGAVYLAEDTQLGRRVALKVPHLDPVEHPQAIERFQREAKAAASLNHPNLCAVYDVGQVNGVHYFTMPYVEGTPLSRRVAKDKPWIPRQAVELVRKLARALEALHGQGLIHRDLKPSNIMVRPDGEPVLMDFGLARSYNDAGDRVTMSGHALGTPAYMAPEQVLGHQGSLGPACDVYGLGTILFQLLTGVLPFQGPPAVVLRQILQHQAPAPSSIRPGLDPALDALCRKALAKSPEDRYDSMLSFGQALDAYLAQGAPAPPPSPRPSHLAPGVVICPGCGQGLRLPPGLATALVRCPGCRTVLDSWGTRMTPPAPAAPPPSTSPRLPSDLDLSPAPAVIPDDLDLTPLGPDLEPPLPLPGFAAGPHELPAVSEADFGQSLLMPARSAVSVPLPARAIPALPPRAPHAPLPTADDFGQSMLMPARQVADLLGQRPPPPSVPQPAPAILPPSRPRRRRAFRLAVAALVLGLLAGGALWFVSHRTTPPWEGPSGPAPGAGATATAGLILLPVSDVTIEAGRNRLLAVRVERQNCRGPIELRLEGLPAGVEVRSALIPTDAAQGGVLLAAEPDASGAGRVRLLAIAANARAEGAFQITVQPREALQAFANSVGMRLVRLPAGTFRMGSPTSEPRRDDDEHLHEVEISRPFYLGTQEVTQRQYERVVGKNPAYFHAGNGGGPDHPVEWVSWDDAATFCAKLSDQAEERAAGRTYRLPTEAEWEYACRAGTTTPFALGATLSSTQANFNGEYPYGAAGRGPNRSKTTPAGSFQANAWGLYDMHGNVAEWCADWQGDYPLSRQKDPAGPPRGENRVVRGGSWTSDGGWFCRSAYRLGASPDRRCAHVGFRVACTLGVPR